MKDVIRALSFANKHHKKQFRKGTKVPYMCHVLNVCRLLALRDAPEELLVAALLHDVVEDTSVTLTQIEGLFGKRVSKLVEGASESMKLEEEVLDAVETWRERKEETIRFIAGAATFGQLLIILADKIDNVQSIAYDYERLGDELWSRFNAGKEAQQWYYTSLLQAFEQRSRQSSVIYEELLKEYREAVERVFPASGKEKNL